MLSEEKATLRLILENKLNDIRYTKQQQWHVLYLTLIAIAGITSLFLGIELNLCFRISLLIVNILVGIIGGGFIIRYACDLATYRDEKIKLIQSLRHYSEKKRRGDIFGFTIGFCLIILISLIPSAILCFV